MNTSRDYAEEHVQTNPPSWNLLRAAFLFFLASIFVLIASLVLYVVKDTTDSSVMGPYESPRQILSTRPGVEGPATLEGGMLIVRGFRCIENDSPVIVEQFLSFRQVDEVSGELRESVSVPSAQKARVAGCFEEDILVILPALVTPGDWYIEGVDRSVQTGELRSWYSNHFQVISRQ